MRNWQRTAVFISAIAAILFLEYHFYFKSKIKESDDLKKELSSLTMEIAQIKPKEIINLDAVSSQIYIKNQLKEISNKLPYEDGVPGLINDFINNASNRLDINYQLFRPSPQSVDEKYKRLPVELGFSCDFADMLGYLENIENMNRIMREDYFEMNIEPDSPLINIKMNISTLLNAGASPFSNLPAETQTVTTKEAIKPVKKIRLREVLLPHFKGIFIGIKTKAFVDDSLIGVGQSIKGYLIEEITEKYVIVSKAYKRYTLKLGR